MLLIVAEMQGLQMLSCALAAGFQKERRWGCSEVAHAGQLLLRQARCTPVLHDACTSCHDTAGACSHAVHHARRL